MKKWAVNSKKELFRKRIFSLIDMECYHPDKDIKHNFFTIKTSDWINVVAETEDNRFILVKQHRLGTDEITIETPGGLIENNEVVEETVIRELREETGYEPAEVHLLKMLSVNPAIQNNYVYFYYAKGCRLVSGQQLDPTEDIEVITATGKELIEMIREGLINHLIVVSAFMHFFISKYNDSIDKDELLRIY